MFFMMEAAFPTEGEGGDLTDWVLGLEADRKKIQNYDIQVVAGWGLLVKLDGTTQRVNLAGLASGLYAKAKVQELSLIHI